MGWLEDIVWRMRSRLRQAGVVPDAPPMVKLRNLIVLNAMMKEADWVEIVVGDDGETSSVFYGTRRGPKKLEMSPPRQLHEPIADQFATLCDYQDDFLGRPTYRGTAWLKVRGAIKVEMRITVARPPDAPSETFIELVVPEPPGDDDRGDGPDLGDLAGSH